MAARPLLSRRSLLLSAPLVVCAGLLCSAQAQALDPPAEEAPSLRKGKRKRRRPRGNRGRWLFKALGGGLALVVLVVGAYFKRKRTREANRG